MWENNSSVELIIHALHMWINHIQTGDVGLSPQDLKNMKQFEKIKPLTIEQMKHLIRLDGLIKNLLLNSRKI